MLWGCLQVMLGLLLDIKNNTQRGAARAQVQLTPATSKWLKSLGTSQICLHNMPWAKLLNVASHMVRTGAFRASSRPLECSCGVSIG